MLLINLSSNVRIAASEYLGSYLWTLSKLSGGFLDDPAVNKTGHKISLKEAWLQPSISERDLLVAYLSGTTRA